MMIKLSGPYPGTQAPKLESDGCSTEVLVKSHAGFYVGYYYNGNWYESFSGEKLNKQFSPHVWYELPYWYELPQLRGMNDVLE